MIVKDMKYWNKFNLLKINLKESGVRNLNNETVYYIISFLAFILWIVAPLLLIGPPTILFFLVLFDVKTNSHITSSLQLKDLVFGMLVASALILACPKLYKRWVKGLRKLPKILQDFIGGLYSYSSVRKGAYYMYIVVCVYYSFTQIKEDESFSMSTLIYSSFMIFMASDASRIISGESNDEDLTYYLDSNHDGEWKLRKMKCDGLYYNITIEATQNFNFLIKKKEDNDISTIKDIRENTTINNSDLKTWLKATSQGGENFWVPMGANKFKITYGIVDSKVMIKLL